MDNPKKKFSFDLFSKSKPKVKLSASTSIIDGAINHFGQKYIKEKYEMIHKELADEIDTADVIERLLGIKFKDFMHISEKIFNLVVFTVNAYNSTSWAQLIMNISAVFINVGMTFVSKIIEKKMRKFLNSQFPQHHAGPNTTTSMKDGLIILFGVLSAVIFGSFKSKIITEFIKETSILGTGEIIKKSVAQVAEWLEEKVIKFFCWIFSSNDNDIVKNMRDKMVAKGIQNKKLNRMHEWYIEVTEKTTQIKCSSDRVSDPNLYEKCTQLLIEGKELLEIVKKTHTILDTGFFSMLRVYNELFSAVNAASVYMKGETRVEPAMLYIAGPSRVGKSRLAEILVTSLAVVEGKRDLHDNGTFCYSRCPSIQYWTTYANHEVTLYDEMFQTILDPKTGDETCKEFLPLISVNPYPLSMAAIQDKSMMFSSKYVIGTSNYAYPNVPAKKDAVVGRFHVHILMMYTSPESKNIYLANRSKQENMLHDKNFVRFFKHRGITTFPYGSKYPGGYSIEFDHPEFYTGKQVPRTFETWELKDDWEPVEISAILDSWRAVAISNSSAKIKLTNDVQIIVDKLNTISEEEKEISGQRKVILFSGAAHFLSNFYPCTIDNNGMTFTSVEQFYQYEKAREMSDVNKMAEILKEDDPYKIKKISHGIVCNEEWHKKKEDILFHGMQLKFSDKDLQEKLMDTKNAILGECQNDKFWAIGTNDKHSTDPSSWKGENKCGLLLMKLRAEIMKTIMLKINQEPPILHDTCEDNLCHLSTILPPIEYIKDSIDPDILGTWMSSAGAIRKHIEKRRFTITQRSLISRSYEVDMVDNKFYVPNRIVKIGSYEYFYSHLSEYVFETNKYIVSTVRAYGQFFYVAFLKINMALVSVTYNNPEEWLNNDFGDQVRDKGTVYIDEMSALMFAEHLYNEIEIDLKVAEVCAGDGRLTKAMKYVGINVVASGDKKECNVENYNELVEFTKEAELVVANPPFENTSIYKNLQRLTATKDIIAFQQYVPGTPLNFFFWDTFLYSMPSIGGKCSPMPITIQHYHKREHHGSKSIKLKIDIEGIPWNTYFINDDNTTTIGGAKYTYDQLHNLFADHQSEASGFTYWDQYCQELEAALSNKLNFNVRQNFWNSYMGHKNYDLSFSAGQALASETGGSLVYDLHELEHVGGLSCYTGKCTLCSILGTMSNDRIIALNHMIQTTINTDLQDKLLQQNKNAQKMSYFSSIMQFTSHKVAMAIGVGTLVAIVGYLIKVLFGWIFKPIANIIKHEALVWDHGAESEDYDLGSRGPGVWVKNTTTGESYFKKGATKSEFGGSSFNFHKNKASAKRAKDRRNKKHHADISDYEPTAMQSDVSNKFIKRIVKVTNMATNCTQYGIDIGASTILINAHIFQEKFESVKLHIVTDTTSFYYNISKKDIKFAKDMGMSCYDKTSDIAFLSVSCLKCTPHLKGSFIDNPIEEVQSILNKQKNAVVLAPSLDDNVFTYYLFNVKYKSFAKDLGFVYGGGTHEVAAYITDCAGLKAGDCGSLLIVLEDGNFRIAGLYTGSVSVTESYFAPVTRKLVEKYLANMPDHHCGDYFDPEDDIFFECYDHLEYQGKYIHDKPSLNNIQKTALIPTIIQKEKIFEQNYMPADLSKEALRKAIAKKDHEFGTYNVEAFQYAKEHLIEVLKTDIGEISMVDLHTAINGEENGEGLDMTTSAGLPYMLERPADKVGKTFLFDEIVGSEYKTYTIKNEYYDRLMEYHGKVMKNIAPGALFKIALKDELRDLERVKEKKTRIFTSAPVDKVISDRIIFSNFIKKFKKKRIDMPHAVGINSLGPEWNKLYLKHIQMDKENNMVLDYSNFDNSHHPSFDKAVYEAISSLTDDVNHRNAIMISYYESTYHYFFFNHGIYRADHGMPSGCVMTTVQNCLLNMFNFYYSWYVICSEFKMYDKIYNFESYNVLHCFGDDLWNTVAKDAASFFNNMSFANVLKSVGFKLTLPEKSGALQEFSSLQSVTFLTRNFVDSPIPEVNGKIGQLPKDKIEAISMYMDKNSDTTAFASAIESMLQESYRYGIKYLDELRAKLRAINDQEINNILIGLPNNKIIKSATLHYNVMRENIKRITFDDVDDDVYFSMFYKEKFKYKNKEYESIAEAYIDTRNNFEGNKVKFNVSKESIINIREGCGKWKRQWFIILKEIAQARFGRKLARYSGHYFMYLDLSDFGCGYTKGNYFGGGIARANYYGEILNSISTS